MKGPYWKNCHNHSPYNTKTRGLSENIRQYVKSIVHDTRNRVNDGMKCVGKGLWYEDCIIHYRNTAETAFLALLHTELCKKRCFCVQAQRSE